jgi:hypothetical protein
MKIEIELPDIPHGHGLSFKKGLADSLLDSKVNESTCHETHKKSYSEGRAIGETIKQEVAKHVKK